MATSVASRATRRDHDGTQRCAVPGRLVPRCLWPCRSVVMKWMATPNRLHTAAPLENGNPASGRVVLSGETPARCRISCSPRCHGRGGRPASDPLRAARISSPAAVAELVDAHGSGPCGGDPVEVRVLSAALPPWVATLGCAPFPCRYRLGD